MVVKPSKRELLLSVCFVMAVCSVAYFIGLVEKRAFDTMTPAGHLEASKAALREHRFDQVARHLSAIPAGAPEALETSRIREELAVAPQAAQLAEERRRTAVRDLQDNLRNLGYDLTVARSDKPDEIVITAKDFDDTDHRVRFLAFLRRQTSPAGEVCLAGFQTLHLKTPNFFSGFSEAYSLECSTWR